MLKKKLKDQKGFTIIEVMIVLAIAGLIMLIVFLAVPALQRSARNTQRKNDAGNLASAVSTWISNNNGSVPGMETGTYASATCTTDMGTIVQGIKLGYYTNTSVSCGASSGLIPTACTSTGTGCTTPKIGTENIVFVAGDTCSGNTPTNSNATTRSYVLLYEVETGGTPSEQCIEG